MCQQPYLYGLDAPDSPLTPTIGRSPSSASADGPQAHPSASDAMMESSVCMPPGYFWPPPPGAGIFPPPPLSADRMMPMGYNEDDLSEYHLHSSNGGSNGCKGMSQISVPRPECTEHRIRVQKRVEQEMNEFLFTLKCRIYKDELHVIIKEIGRNETQRSCISYLSSCPTIQLNLAERQTLAKLGDLPTLMVRKGGNTVPDGNQANLDPVAKNLDDLLTELLNSLSNRLLFYILIEYRSWFPQDRARGQIVDVILRALFGEELESMRKASPDLIKYIEAFVVQRTKNFRDVISRVLKREKSK